MFRVGFYGRPFPRGGFYNRELREVVTSPPPPRLSSQGQARFSFVDIFCSSILGDGEGEWVTLYLTDVMILYVQIKDKFMICM